MSTYLDSYFIFGKSIRSLAFGYFLIISPFWMVSCQSSSTPSEAKPNIVLIMVDDMGYSDIGCYGGEIPTPHIDQLAADGIRFSQFYNTARCCPTRASLLTGLFPHQTGIGQMTNSPTKQPYQDWGTEGYIGYLNQKCVTIGELLEGQGYHTYMTGKWHLGYHAKERWPLQRGFEKFYGIISGASSYFWPHGKRGLTLIDLFSGIIKRLQAANFILHFVKKPRRCIGIAYVFCLIQYKILLTFAHS